jgi:Putative Flp pilus-assembly TadE/G-like
MLVPRRPLLRLAADRKGAIAIMMALAAVVLLGFVGLGVDVASWETAKRAMQGAADQAAFSAAIAVNAGGAATANAQGVAAQMGFVGNAANCKQNTQTDVTVCVNNPPKQGAYVGYSQGWEVLITQPQQTFLSRVFLTSVTASAHAVALSQIPGDFCIIQLNRTASPGFKFSGTSASVSTPNCNIQVDSGAAAAANCNGNNIISANILAVAGGQNCNSNVAPGTKIVSPATTTPNPYPQNLVPDPDCTNNGNGFVTYTKSVNGGTLTPTTGSPPQLVWCDSQGLTLDGFVTLNPGLYILTAGQLKINSTATVTGTGVTIVLLGTASLSIGGGANVTLSGPPTATSTWPTAGLVFYQPSSDTQAASIGGGGTVNFTGTLDFAGAAVSYGGSSGGPTSQCTHLIADTITVSGGPTFGNNCVGITNDITGSPPRLAE